MCNVNDLSQDVKSVSWLSTGECRAVWAGEACIVQLWETSACGVYVWCTVRFAGRGGRRGTTLQLPTAGQCTQLCTRCLPHAQPPGNRTHQVSSCQVLSTAYPYLWGYMYYVDTTAIGAWLNGYCTLSTVAVCILFECPSFHHHLKLLEQAVAIVPLL